MDKIIHEWTDDQGYEHILKTNSRGAFLHIRKDLSYNPYAPLSPSPGGEILLEEFARLAAENEALRKVADAARSYILVTALVDGGEETDRKYRRLILEALEALEETK